jgi:hypothetical protein
MRETLKGARRFRALSDQCYAEVHTTGGVGLISVGLDRYRPTLDLTGLAVKICDLMNGGRYVTEPALAENIPEVWFDEHHRGVARKRLKRAPATVFISGTLRGTQREQDLMLWVAELPTTTDAEGLVNDVGTGMDHDGRVIVGFSAGRLFGLLVAGSTTVGVEPFESPKTVAQLVEQIRPLLAQARQTTSAASGSNVVR